MENNNTLEKARYADAILGTCLGTRCLLPWGSAAASWCRAQPLSPDAWLSHHQPVASQASRACGLPGAKLASRPCGHAARRPPLGRAARPTPHRASPAVPLREASRVQALGRHELARFNFDGPVWGKSK